MSGDGSVTGENTRSLRVAGQPTQGYPHERAAPRFVIFEAWECVLLKLKDFPKTIQPRKFVLVRAACLEPMRTLDEQ